MKIIKRYPRNRKLYDQEASQYMNLDELNYMINKNIEFRVECTLTKKDMTDLVLVQLMAYKQRVKSTLFSSEVLKNLIKETI